MWPLWEVTKEIPFTRYNITHNREHAYMFGDKGIHWNAPFKFCLSLTQFCDNFHTVTLMTGLHDESMQKFTASVFPTPLQLSSRLGWVPYSIILY